ncbi:MAG: hypothetical protein R3E58_07440 [Phycisphaerae bacterium]|nr:hypothetical protein [Phycisphaerales bacterium]
MTTKRILILANSIKKNARCVAGREILDDGVKRRLGEWIRPISRLSEGELLPNHYHYPNGVEASVLDIADLEFSSISPGPGQPENWLIDDEKSWHFVKSVDPRHIAIVEESPKDLWLVQGARVDRISVDDQALRKPQSSLVVVRPEEFQIRMWSDKPPWLAHVRRFTKAIFTYAGTHYSLSITDPVFTQKYCSNHPGEGEAALVFTPPNGGRCLICVSLTPPFDGYHYKVVATVLDLP